MSYTVNGFYKHHVTVVAEVVAVALELSTEELVLYPSYGMPAEAGKFSILKKNFEKKICVCRAMVHVLHKINDCTILQHPS